MKEALRNEILEKFSLTYFGKDAEFMGSLLGQIDGLLEANGEAHLFFDFGDGYCCKALGDRFPERSEVGNGYWVASVFPSEIVLDYCVFIRYRGEHEVRLVKRGDCCDCEFLVRVA